MMHRKNTWNINPIFLMEMRSRMRGRRSFLTLTSMLLLFGVFSYGLYRLVLATSAYDPMPLGPKIGQILFAGLAFLEMILILLLTPAITANAISSEIEKLTYEMLLATPLHPVRILWGKLLSTLSYIFLLIFAAIPMTSLIFLFGGVSIREILKALLVLVCTSIMLGVLGLFLSTVFQRSSRATVITYLIVVLITVIPIITTSIFTTFQGLQPPRWLLVPSPVSALSSAISPSIDQQTTMGRFWMVATSLNLGPPPISTTSIPRPTYHYSLTLYAAISLMLYMITSRLILPTRRWRIQWTEILIGLILLFGLAGFVTIAYFSTTNRYESIQIITSGPEGTIEPGNPVNP